MRNRFAPLLVLALILALTAVVVAPAGASPGKTSACTGCHSGAASGSVTAVPSTTTPAPGAAYTVNIGIGLTASGNTGYHVAQTDAAGTATTFTGVNGGPAAQTTWAPSMTAPTTPGTYYYKVWGVKGPASSSGMAKTALYSITVPAFGVAPAAYYVTPSSGIVGSTFVVAGANLGSGGTVTVGGVSAATSAWSATSVTCTVPAGLSVGAKDVVVTPTGGSATNALSFTVTLVPPPAGSGDTTPPVTVAAGLPAMPWCNHAVTVSLAAADNAGGSGVTSIFYRVDGGAPVPVAGTTADVPLDVVRPAHRRLLRQGRRGQRRAGQVSDGRDRHEQAAAGRVTRGEGPPRPHCGSALPDPGRDAQRRRRDRHHRHPQPPRQDREAASPG